MTEPSENQKGKAKFDTDEITVQVRNKEQPLSVPHPLFYSSSAHEENLRMINTT